MDDKKEPELTAKKRYFFKPGWAYIFSHGSLGYFLSWWERKSRKFICLKALESFQSSENLWG